MRNRKPVAIILIAAFVQLTTACVSTRRLAPETVNPAAKDYRIVRILKSSGERIEIDKSTPARIIGSDIHIGGRLRMPVAGTKVVKRDGEYAVTPANGLTFETDSLDTVGKDFVLWTKSDIVIPLSEVSAVWNKETNTGLTILAVVGGIAVAAGVVLAMAAASLRDAFNGIHW